ncbi:MAG: hypothetical protein V4724_09465 [Pseudomonadota bacterium]
MANHFSDDKHMDVCREIEIGLKRQYEIHPDLTDGLCSLALDNAKIAIKQKFGYALNESVLSAEEAQGIIAWCVELGQERIGKGDELTLKEYVALLDKIKRSVVRHNPDGSRAYYEFVRNFLP